MFYASWLLFLLICLTDRIWVPHYMKSTLLKKLVNFKNKGKLLSSGAGSKLQPNGLILLMGFVFHSQLGG